MIEVLKTDFIKLFRYKSTYVALFFFVSMAHGTGSILVRGVGEVWVDTTVVYNWFQFENIGILLGGFVVSPLVNNILIWDREDKILFSNNNFNKNKIFATKILLITIIISVLVLLRVIWVTVHVAYLMEVKILNFGKMIPLINYFFRTLLRNLTLMSTYLLINLFIKNKAIYYIVCFCSEQLIVRIVIIIFSKFFLFLRNLDKIMYYSWDYMQLNGIETVFWIDNCVIIGVVCMVLAFKGWNKKISNWGN